MKESQSDIDKDKVFTALADKSRRKIIEQLYQGETTLLELSDSFSVSVQALSKQIKILENAQILTKRKQGKYRVLSLNKQALRSSLEWISYFSKFWNESFDELESVISKTKNGAKSE